ncbi:hypothetical protein LIA77_05992 [Sarocladium implicatum]|nr:hypothetical protein LIA77_05992 [Sarocladium implicatum]
MRFTTFIFNHPTTIAQWITTAWTVMSSLARRVGADTIWPIRRAGQVQYLRVSNGVCAHCPPGYLPTLESRCADRRARQMTTGVEAFICQKHVRTSRLFAKDRKASGSSECVRRPRRAGGMNEWTRARLEWPLMSSSGEYSSGSDSG